MDSLSEAKLQLVCPALALKIQSLYGLITYEPIRVTQGFRSWAEQAKLWRQGRGDPGEIVTNAPPGHSWHEFGLAVDVAPFDAEGNPDWNLSHPVWQQIIKSGEALGLYSGDEFVHCSKDDPHFQLTGTFPVSPNDEVRQIFLTQGMKAVWQQAGLVT
jgi:peptidoglycan LD-endopeptidase CwlK